MVGEDSGDGWASGVVPFADLSDLRSGSSGEPAAGSLVFGGGSGDRPVEVQEEALAGMDQQVQADGHVAEIPVSQDLPPEAYAETMPPVDGVEQQVFDQADTYVAPEPVD